MKLSRGQTEKLMEFTRKKGVRYFDLQVEIVDHLAKDIEAIIKDEPELDFEEALLKSYKKFGLFGFAHLVRDKEIALLEEARKRGKAFRNSLLKSPQFFLFIGILVFIYFANNIHWILGVCLLGMLWLIDVYLSISKWMWLKKLKHKLSFTDTNYWYSDTFWVILVYFSFKLFDKVFDWPIFKLPITYAIFFIALSILFIIKVHLKYKDFENIKNRVQREFPEALA